MLQRSLPLILICAGLSWLSPQAGAQNLGPGEVNSVSEPYRPRSKFTLKVDTRLVEVGVVVRDSRGHTVGGLKKEDFEITDDGKKRAIAGFSMETAPGTTAAAGGGQIPAEAAPAPAAKVRQRYVALLFDDFTIGPGELPQAQTAAKRFVTQSLGAGDHVGVFTISGTQNLAFTTDVGKLTEAIAKLRLNSRKPHGGICPQMTPYEAYAIANRIDLTAFNVKLAEANACANMPPSADATSFEGTSARSTGSGRRAGPAPPSSQVIQQVNGQARSIWEQVRLYAQISLESVRDVVDLVAQMPDNRTVLLTSSGFLSGGLENQMDEIIRHALHAGVVINALDAKGLYTDDPIQIPRGGNARSVIQAQLSAGISKASESDAIASLAYNTGGLFFHNNNDLELGFRELGMRPETSYLMNFAPEGVPDGKYHKLKVRLVASKGNTVQARQGYVALDPASAEPPPERRIDSLAQNDENLGEAAGGLYGIRTLPENGESMVQAVFHLEIGQLKYKELFGTRNQTIKLIAVLQDPNGNFVMGKEGTVTLQLSAASYERLAPQGMNVTLQVPAPPGMYRLRTVLQEGIEGKCTTSLQPVEVK